MDLQKYIKTKKDKRFQALSESLPEDVDTEGTPESRKRVQELHLLADPALYNKQMNMKAAKEVSDSNKRSLADRMKSRKKKSMSNTEASEVYVGLGTKGRSGAF